MLRAYLLCPLLAACVVVPAGSPPQQPTVAADSAPAPHRSPSADTTPQCPSDLSLDRGKRSIATYQADIDTRPSHLAPGHKKPLTRAFGLEPDDAVARVLAVEAKHPELVPAGFRAEVLANPRDGALRARMADCEAQHSETQRRAGYDSALAFLLHKGFTLSRAQVDLLVAGQKPSLAQQQFYFISKDELAIEDALTRGLYTQRGRLGATGFAIWGQTFMHSCGGFACRVTDRSAGFGDPDLISWDLRDGGTFSGTTGTQAREQRETNCKAHTGYTFLEECETGCETTGQHGGACHTKCQAYCEPHDS
jgi:hypothetical protein